jgi:alpha-1,3-rhamnosyl/mannosyltransferase
VVCSNAASLPEVCGQAAWLVDPLDIEGWAGAIETVLTDPARGEEMRALGLLQAARFTWEKAAVETLNTYAQVLEAG